MADSKNVSSPNNQDWKTLYRVGGVAALLTAIFIPIQVTAFAVWPPPFQGSVADWFALFQKSRLIGLFLHRTQR